MWINKFHISCPFFLPRGSTLSDIEQFLASSRENVNTNLIAAFLSSIPPKDQNDLNWTNKTLRDQLKYDRNKLNFPSFTNNNDTELRGRSVLRDIFVLKAREAAAVAAIQMQQIGARILCTDETFKVAKHTDLSVKAVATFMNEYGEYVNIRSVGKTEENDGAQLLKFRDRLIRIREMETGEDAPSRTRSCVEHNISSDKSEPAHEKCAVDHIVTDNCCDKRNSILLRYFNPVSGYVGLDRYSFSLILFFSLSK